ncbi:hypothetical protein JGU66_09705 [Myxococcaceae bacterium JPH2]|nr:hypothetical protein [Myxococcaceae bacterium JPH2]
MSPRESGDGASFSDVTGSEAVASEVVPWTPPESPQVPAPVPAGTGPRAVLALAEEARHAESSRRPALCSQLNQLIGDVVKQAEGREAADLLHGLLEGGVLADLEDAQGRTCRAAAVEGLLTLGFPFALEVRPEDLAHLRAERGGGKGLGRMGLPLLLLGLGVALQAGYQLLHPDSPSEWALAQGGLSLVLMVLLGAAPPKSVLYRVALSLLVVLSGLGVVVSLMTPLDAGGVSGLAGLAAVVLLAHRES